MNRDEDRAPAKSPLLQTNDGTTVYVVLHVQGETRELGAILISWPREEFYRERKDIDYRARLDS